MFQKIRLQFLNNEACPVSAGANMDIIQAGGTDIKINIRESSQPCMAQSVSQNHECLSVASSHGVADTLCSVLMFGLATAHHHLIVIFQNITSKMGSGSSKLSAQQVEGVNVVIIGNGI